MKNLQDLLYVILAVLIAATANSVSAVWARNPDRISIWLFLLVLISPFVFITFGLVTSKVGLSVTSGVIDSSLTVVTILIGLIIFSEWNKISMHQYIGLALAISGIALIVFFPKAIEK